eukprot:845657-Rhodomonas_salina.1
MTLGDVLPALALHRGALGPAAWLRAQGVRPERLLAGRSLMLFAAERRHFAAVKWLASTGFRSLALHRSPPPAGPLSTTLPSSPVRRLGLSGRVKGLAQTLKPQHQA